MESEQSDAMEQCGAAASQSEARVHEPRPSTEFGLKYQARPGFKSALAIGGPIPDGAAHTLDGRSVTLHALLPDDQLTILNFGSST